MEVSDTTVLYGLIEFSMPLACAPDVSGCTIPIALNGIDGMLLFPKLPDFPDKAGHALDRPLSGPAPAITWKRGEELVYWGRPTSYPTGSFRAETVLVEFRLPTAGLEATATTAYEAFADWRANFDAHVEWLTEQRKWSGVKVQRQVEGLDLFAFGADGKPFRPQNPQPTSITIGMLSDRCLLDLNQLKQICVRCSAGKQVPFEVEFQLEAYRAFAQGDYRKAVIDSATCAELTLTRAITIACSASGRHGESLLKRPEYRMLGGRIRLAMHLGVMPTVLDLWKSVAGPRNDAIHAGAIVSEATARTAVNAIDMLFLCLGVDDIAIKRRLGPGKNRSAVSWASVSAQSA